jgi:sterol desaturase/sphingolipid hydroxylase (fatty acid hydroxylase superfamily)
MSLDAFLQLFQLRELILVAAIFVPAERLLARRPEQPILRKWWWNDLIYLLFNRILIYIGFAVMILGAGAVLRVLVPPDLRGAVAAQPLWIQVVEAIVLADLGFYAAHRMFHSVPALWKFHAVHHSIEELDWLAAARVHPVDQVVTKTMSTLPLYVLGFSDAAFGIFSVLYFWQSVLVHANVQLNFGPLRKLIASPEFHHWHHANQPEAFNTNYAGQLSVIDKLFGTLYLPAGQRPTRYGVNDPVPHTYLDQLVYPFERARPTAPVVANPASKITALSVQGTD